MALTSQTAQLLVAGANGVGKRTPFDDYRIQARGGKGIITMKTGDKTGGVVAAIAVEDNDQLMLITNRGQMVRIRVSEIREAGRNTMGVKLIDLNSREKLSAVAPVIQDEEEEEEVTAPEEATSAEPPATPAEGEDSAPAEE